MLLNKQLIYSVLVGAIASACFEDNVPIIRSVPEQECNQASLSERCFSEEWDIYESSENASIHYYSKFGVLVYDTMLRTKQPIQYHLGETLDAVVFWDTTIHRTTELAIRLFSSEISFWQRIYAWDSLPEQGPVVAISDTLLEENPEECWPGTYYPMDVCLSSPFMIMDALQDKFQYTQFHFFTEDEQVYVQFTYNDKSAEPTRLQLPEINNFYLELDCRDNTLPEEGCSFYYVHIDRN